MIKKTIAIAAGMLLAMSAEAQNPFVQTWCTSYGTRRYDVCIYWPRRGRR